VIGNLKERNRLGYETRS